MLRLAFLALALPLSLLACAGPGDLEVLEGSGPDLGSRRAPIYGGSTDYREYHGSVVALHRLANGGSTVYIEPFCSGTLIRPDVVLTAAHCLDAANGWGPNFSTMNPADLAVYVGNNPTAVVDGTYDLVFHLYPAQETVIYAGYDRRNIRNDVALVRLAGPVTEEYARVVPELPGELRLGQADIGSLMNFAGFGENNTGHEYGTKLHVDAPLGALPSATEA